MSTAVHVGIHLHDDDPFTAYIIDGRPNDLPPFVSVEAGAAKIFVQNPAQADSLIRAATAAKELLREAAAS